MSTVAMLNKVEQMIIQHMEIFDEFEEKDPVMFKKLKKDIKKQELNDNQQKKKDDEKKKMEDYKI